MVDGKTERSQSFEVFDEAVLTVGILIQRLQYPHFRDCLVEYLEALIKLDFTWSALPDETNVLGSSHRSPPG